MKLHAVFLLIIIALIAPLISAPARAKAQASLDVPEVKVLSLGDEASRQPLRLKGEVGFEGEIKMTSINDTETLVAGQPAPIKTQQRTEMTVKVQIEEAGADHLNFTFQAIDINAIGNDAMLQIAPIFKKTRWHITTTRRNIYQSSRVDFPPETPEMLGPMLEMFVDAFKSSAIAFPEDAVGKGAQWTIEHQISMMGISVNQSSTVTLVDRVGDTVTLSVAFTHMSESQKMSMPGIPPDIDVQVKRYDGEGSMEITFDLARMFPDSRMKSDGNMHMIMTMPGSVQDMKIQSGLATESKNVKK